MVTPRRLSTLAASTTTGTPPASNFGSAGARSLSGANASLYWKPPGPRPATAMRSTRPSRPSFFISSMILPRAAAVIVTSASLIQRSSGCIVSTPRDCVRRRRDLEAQQGVRLAQGTLHVGGASGAREHEPEVAAPFRKRNHFLTDGNRDPDVFDARHPS